MQLKKKKIKKSNKINNNLTRFLKPNKKNSTSWLSNKSSTQQYQYKRYKKQEEIKFPIEHNIRRIKSYIWKKNGAKRHYHKRPFWQRKSFKPTIRIKQIFGGVIPSLGLKIYKRRTVWELFVERVQRVKLRWSWINRIYSNVFMQRFLKLPSRRQLYKLHKRIKRKPKRVLRFYQFCYWRLDSFISRLRLHTDMWSILRSRFLILRGFVWVNFYPLINYNYILRIFDVINLIIGKSTMVGKVWAWFRRYLPKFGSKYRVNYRSSFFKTANILDNFNISEMGLAVRIGFYSKIKDMFKASRNFYSNFYLASFIIFFFIILIASISYFERFWIHVRHKIQRENLIDNFINLRFGH